ncbi:MAG: glucose-1-phosphate cytidylyltransferase [Planctomycetaceae bacterium]|nr:glucose-1-phosphate cytidylyltransferase [Planctomycetaceae bacterium]
MIKVAILAGGLGTRFAEETDLKPKPMISIGAFPILWHIMKYFSEFSFENFFVATGYKGEVIRSYFAGYHTTSGSIMVDLGTGQVRNYAVPPEQWKVHLLDTGPVTQTGGRIKRMEEWLRGPEPFIVTYGDGLADIDLHALVKFHKSHGKLATVTAVRPPARYGAINFDGDRVESFSEKPQSGEGWINGGFMVFNETIFDYLHNDKDALERHGLECLAEDGQLMAFKHDGFWQCMDTFRDKIYLEELWKSGNAPWKVWQEPVLLRIRKAA